MKNKEQLDELKRLHEIWSQLKPWQRKVLRWQGEAVYVAICFIDLIYRVDLWLYPPAAFFATYNLAVQNIPDHPMKMMVVLGTSIMCASFVMLVIRPSRTNWVKARR